MVFGFFSIPASADPEDRTTVGKEVECGQSLGHGDGIAFDQQRYAGGQANAFGCGCHCRERNKGIERVGIFLGKFGAAGVWGFSTYRYMGMFGQPERFESALFRVSSDVNDVVGRIPSQNKKFQCPSRLPRS